MMTIKKMMAVGLIFMLASAGWWILAGATHSRSSGYFRRLGVQVENLWGTPLVQRAPQFSVQIPGTDKVRWLLPVSNDIRVRLDTDYRKKGLVWYPTYVCAFEAVYKITNEDAVVQKARLHFAFPAAGATYDNFSAAIDGVPLRVAVKTGEGIGEIMEIPPGASREFRVTYRTRGIREWRYQTDRDAGRVKGLNLVVETGFAKVDYPDGGLSPMQASASHGGMALTWKAEDLITSQDIGVVIPEKLNPGPLTSRITTFAPVCLLFFFVLVGSISIVYRIEIHPMHYLFVAAGFFAFHLLLVYMVGIINIHVAFIIASITSVGLVTSYLMAALRGRLPWMLAVGGQVFFLVLFSYSFFLQGITGLTVAIGSVVTLAVLMKVTAHTDWNRVGAVSGGPEKGITG